MVNSHIAEIMLLFSRCFFLVNPVLLVIRHQSCCEDPPSDLGFVSTESGAAELEAARHKAVSAWMTATFGWRFLHG